MRKLLLVIATLFFIFGISFIGVQAQASIFSEGNTVIPICEWDSCWLDKWIEQLAETDMPWIVKDWKASEYIQKIIIYVLWFLKIVAVILVIYAGFNILTSAWDEEKAKNSKKIIIFTIIWLLIIYLAWPIINFVLDILSLGK